MAIQNHGLLNKNRLSKMFGQNIVIAINGVSINSIRTSNDMEDNLDNKLSRKVCYD